MLVIQTVLSKVIWVASSSTDSWVSNGVREMNASSVRACSSSLLGRLGRFRQKLWLTKTGSMLTVSYLIVLKECLPVYPREYSMILNKNSASSTINSLQGLSGSSQSGWCCRNPSVFHMFFISGGSKSERISTTETTRNDDHLQVGTLFNMVGAGQVGSTAASFDRFQKRPKTSGKRIFFWEF